MSHNVAPSRAENGGQAGNALWDLDPTLLPLLRSIVAAVAEAGAAARFVVTPSSGAPYSLVAVRGSHYAWRPLVTEVLEHAELMRGDGTVAAPVWISHGLGGVLLLHHDAAHPPAGAEHIMRAHAAWLQSTLAASSAALAAAHSTVDALMQALAAHDPDTARHARLVCRLAHALGTAAELCPHALLELEWAALLHDVGKIGVAPRLLQKSGPLSATEWALMRQHPATGERIVRATPGLTAIGDAIRHHHEYWNGEGYPDRLAGEAIPIGARLITMADTYETMRTGRPYQPPFGRDETIHALRQGAGTQFDPTLLSLLTVLADHDIDL